MIPATCDHECDPMAIGARDIGSVHYLDCPIWAYLGVDPSTLTPGSDASAPSTSPGLTTNDNPGSAA